MSPEDADGSTDSSPLFDEIASIEDSRRRRRPAPVLPSRSATMGKVRQQATEDKAVETQKKAKTGTKKKGKRKKKRSSYFDPKETLSLVAGVGAFVAVLAFLAWGYPDLRFPLGGFLCVLGFIVYLLGSALLRQLVAEEGAIKALLFRFCPPYQLWYVARNWAETKDFVAFFVAGFVVMSIGGAVIKSSPVGQKAEASESAYQKMVRDPEVKTPPADSKTMVEIDD